MPTLKELRDLAKARADMQSSAFVSDAEWNSYLNGSAKELYDLLVETSEDYALEKAECTADGTADHLALPDDFYKLRGVDEKISGEWIPLRRFSLLARAAQRRNRYPVWRRRYRISGKHLWLDRQPPSGTEFRIWYVPVLTALATDDDVLDDVQGWSEFVVVDAARKALAKEESDTAPLERELLSVRQRIKEAAANRDQGEAVTVSDVYAANVSLLVDPEIIE